LHTAARGTVLPQCHTVQAAVQELRAKRIVQPFWPTLVLTGVARLSNDKRTYVVLTASFIVSVLMFSAQANDMSKTTWNVQNNNKLRANLQVDEDPIWSPNIIGPSKRVKSRGGIVTQPFLLEREYPDLVIDKMRSGCMTKRRQGVPYKTMLAYCDCAAEVVPKNVMLSDFVLLELALEANNEDALEGQHKEVLEKLKRVEDYCAAKAV